MLGCGFFVTEMDLFVVVGEIDLVSSENAIGCGLLYRLTRVGDAERWWL